MPINLINMEGTVPIIMIMEGTRPPTGASPTQPYKCGQNVKVKTSNGRDNNNTNPPTKYGRPTGRPILFRYDDYGALNQQHNAPRTGPSCCCCP
jgi:hypothetical protein